MQRERQSAFAWRATPIVARHMPRLPQSRFRKNAIDRTRRRVSPHRAVTNLPLGRIPMRSWPDRLAVVGNGAGRVIRRPSSIFIAVTSRENRSMDRATVAREIGRASVASITILTSPSAHPISLTRLGAGSAAAIGHRI
jgi:hypothetical protein